MVPEGLDRLMVKECNTFNLWFQVLFNSKKKGREEGNREKERKAKRERKGNQLFIVARKVQCGMYGEITL